jgi:hypothetical protein
VVAAYRQPWTIHGFVTRCSLVLAPCQHKAASFSDRFRGIWIGNPPKTANIFRRYVHDNNKPIKLLEKISFHT